jgi:DNA topoisomerase-3
LKILIIAEKPSLMNDIKKAYTTLPTKPFDADFTCFAGHLMGLKEPEEYNADWGKPWRESVLPMIPGTFKYSIKKNCATKAKEIKSMLDSGKYDCVINACDADREGEAIFWSFYNNTICKLPVKRFWSSDPTTPALQKALNDLRDYSKDQGLCNLRDASFCRGYFDWLIGMNLSRAVTLRQNQNASIGRVQTPTLNLVVKRDLEIENFKSVNFYEIQATFNTPKGIYQGSWFNEKTKATSFPSESKTTVFSTGVLFLSIGSILYLAFITL